MDSRKLTIGQHLEELRMRILRALLWILAAFVVAFWFQAELMTLVVQPHVSAIETISGRLRGEAFERRFATAAPEVEEVFAALSNARERLQTAEAELPAEALDAVRAEVVRGQVLADSATAAAQAFERALASYQAGADSTALPGLISALDRWRTAVRTFEQEVAQGLRARLPESEEKVLEVDPKLRVLRYPESFLSHFKVALILAIFFASPLAGRELWSFVAAGLYAHESRYVVIFAPASFFLFVGGALFGYFILIPIGLSYMATYGDPSYLALGITLSDYLSLFILLTVFLGLVFQLPLILLFLGKIGLVDPPRLRKGRRYLILLAFVLSAVLTPPDPITQVLMAVPMVLLYEIGIVLVQLFGKPVTAPEEASDAA